MSAILVVIGTRPEAIKMLPVVRALRAEPGLRPIVLVTGQHGAMVDQVFGSFGERPDQDLGLAAGQSLSDQTAQLLQTLPPAFARHRPALVLVHGDTTTAMAAALAAFYAGIPIGHVEAGLRSHDICDPWPEEYNRVAIDAMASLLFAPTEAAAEHLRRESPRPRGIAVTGNTGIDALLHIEARLTGEELRGVGPPHDPARHLIVVTAHRRESFGGGIERICQALVRIAARGDVDLIYPVHPNPEVREVAYALLSRVEGIYLVAPLDYPQMVTAMKRATLILTDSGGIQEEAPALGTPVLVMREATERGETVAAGLALLVGTNPDRIVQETSRLLDHPEHPARRQPKAFPYGDGAAAPRIAREIAVFCQRRDPV